MVTQSGCSSQCQALRTVFVFGSRAPGFCGCGCACPPVSRLVAVHAQWGMPGVVSLSDVLWLHSPCCYVPPKPGGPKPGWEHGLGAALAVLRPAFANRSLAGIFLGDELEAVSAPGVPSLTPGNRPHPRQAVPAPHIHVTP